MAARQVQSGDRSRNFTMACNLLSQYIKENSFVPRPIEPTQGRLEHVPVTMNLFPGVDASDECNEREMDVAGSRVNELELFPRQPTVTQDIREEESSQLTIMYGGKVLVFDNYSAEKADMLIDMVNKASPNATIASPSSVPESKNVPVIMKSALIPKGQACISSQPICPDLPLSRKASLQRFFEKRKDRIHAKGPYSKASPAKSEDSASSWLGLVSQVSTKHSFSQGSDSSK